MSTPETLREQKYNATVVSKILLTPNLMTLRAVTDEPREQFSAGQYTTLGLFGFEPRSSNSDAEFEPAPPERLIQRAYSIASARHQTREFEFYVTQVKSGQLTPRLFALEVGDRLFVGRRIVGVFNLSDVPPEKDVLMIATGTGIAPFISFLRSHVAERPKSRMVVVQGAAHQRDLGYYSELAFLNHTFPNFFYLPTLTDADGTWAGRRMWIEDILASGEIERETGVALDPERTHVYVCGNPRMVANVASWLEDHAGYRRHRPKEPGQLFIEEF
ncbi:ferredoxin--NADP reductase [Oceanithermus sp.]